MKAGCFLGANGPMRSEDLTDGDPTAVEEFQKLLIIDCGCTPDRECTRHYLDEDDRMRRREDV